MWLYGCKPLIVSHHLAIFGDHWFSANRDVTYLICYSTSKIHMTEGSYYGPELLILYHHPAMFIGHSGFSIEDMFLIHHVIPKDHVTWGPWDLMGKSPSR